MVKNYKYYILFFIALIITSFGDSLVMKANIGTNAYETISMTLNYVTDIKIGTAGLICNCVCMLFCVLYHKKITMTTLLQIPMCIILGYVINFFYYVLFDNLVLTYPIRLTMAVIGLIISAASCGFLMTLDIVAFPYETFCLIISEQIKKEYSKVHMSTDLLAIIVTTIISLFLHLSFATREASIISMLIFGPVMGIVMNKSKGVLERI